MSIKDHIRSLMRAPDSSRLRFTPAIFHSFFPKNEIFLHEKKARSDAVRTEDLHDSFMQLRKLESFARINFLAFSKALKKFDKKNKDAAVTNMVRPLLDQSPLANLGSLFELQKLIEGCLKTTIPSSVDSPNREIKTIIDIWNEIYEFQMRAILEKDDVESIKSRLNYIIGECNHSSVVEIELEALKNFILLGACFHGALNIAQFIMENVNDVSAIEDTLGISLIETVIRSDRCLQKSNITRLLIQRNASVHGRNHHDQGLIHLCAIHGVSTVLPLLLEVLGPSTYDIDGCTPLYYAIVKNHADAVRILLNFLSASNEPNTLVQNSTLNPLILASKQGNIDIIAQILDHGENVNLQDSDGETALYHCVKRDYVQCLALLLERGADANIPEKISGTTPLAAGAMGGFDQCVNLLLSHGAGRGNADFEGWLPFEHAVFRGHLSLGQVLKPQPYEYYIPDTKLQDGVQCSRQLEYGHAVLTGHTELQISFGHVSGPRSPKPAVDLISRPPFIISALRLKIWSTNKHLLLPKLIWLPITGDEDQKVKISLDYSGIANTRSTDQIIFDLLERNGDEEEPLARGTFFLYSIIDEGGNVISPTPKKFLVPLSDPKTMDLIALLAFEALIIKPFAAINELRKGKIYWRAIDTLVIGHRGFGANTRIGGGMQLGENTVLSFVTAASLGAEYVEFDVQVTRDKIPVLYHDFIFRESGLDIPIGMLTMDQFLGFRSHLNPRATNNGAKQWGAADDLSILKADKKGGNIVQSSFATLEEAFLGVPEKIGFNIEIKYPSDGEKEFFQIHNTQELNCFCDAILDVIRRKANDRPIILSSFHPEVCLLLSLKQVSFPVFFLTSAGCGFKDPDPRRNSLAAAIKFARSSKLMGIVSHSTPIIMAPKLIQSVRENCLMLFTYGPLNNNIENARLQKKFGVDAVIVDSVARIRRGLG